MMGHLSRMSTVFYFNQYYWDLCKKLKSAAKAAENNHVRKAIRASYASIDMNDVTHIESFIARDGASEFMECYAKGDTCEELDDLITSCPLELYTGIQIKEISKLIEVFVIHQYLTVFIVLSKLRARITKEQAGTLVHKLKLLYSPSREIEENVDELKSLLDNDEGCYKMIMRLRGYGMKQEKDIFEGFKDLETTSIGQLAREIVNELDLDDISKSMEGGDIFAAMQKDNGLGKLISTVGSKIQNKLASGELNQEALMKDALSLAAKLPQMMPGGLGGLGSMGNAGMGDLGAMMSNLQQMTSALGLGGAGGGVGRGAGTRGTGTGAGAGSRSTSARHSSAQEKLRRKLAAKKREQGSQ